MEEVTTMLGTSRSTINDAVRDGRFAKKLKPFGGRAIRFDRAEIMALMEQNKTNDSGKTHNKSTKE
jgi:excisionase family DNA binding protein